MSTISTNYNTSVQTNYRVENSQSLSDAQIHAKVVEIQTENLKAIEKGIDQNSAGWGDKVKIKVPADAYGDRILNPSPKDWENAVKNNRFTEVEDVPYRFALNHFSVRFADFKDHNTNLTANKVLLGELRDALDKGISFPATVSIPASEQGDIVRGFQAQQKALNDIITPPAKDSIQIQVPADSKGNPIKNPSNGDWIQAHKNNRWATASGKPEQLALDFYGVQANPVGFSEASQNIGQKLDSYIRQANGEYVLDAIIDIPNAGKILAEVFAVLGPAYTSELSKADDLRKQMDSLRKKNDALQKLENSISGGDTAGGFVVDDFNVPTKRYVYDSDGNKVLDSNGKPKTEAVGAPPSDQDWARAAEWKSVKELNGGKGLIGRDVAEKYFGFKLSSLTKGTDVHNINLSNNIQKIGNARTAVQSEMSKLSGQFDFYMGNGQTNLQNANKIIASVNDMMMGIARGI